MHLFFKHGGIGSVLFVLVVMSASAYAATCGGFDDVDASDPYCAAVERIRDAGITEGCNPPANTRYCPDGVVTRGQMATFLARALDLPATTDKCGLSDIAGNVHAKNICAIKTAGITKGCNPPANTRFCPDNPTTRGQMAAFLRRALKLPACNLSNYTDVPSNHTFARDICAIWKAGIAVSYRHPDPVNNRYNNTYGPNAPMRRGAMAILLDRAFVQPPADPLKVRVGSAYRTALSKAHAYELNSSAEWRRPGEILGFVYFYRAARKVKNLPAGVKAGTYLAKMKAAADTILTYYRDDCFAGHCGNGTGATIKCARFNHTSGESDDRGSNYTIALLEATRLLFEVGGTANINKGKTYWTKALYATAHYNDDHMLTSPTVGWGRSCDRRIKWNISNRWAIANYLIYDIRERFGHIVGGNGEPYGDNAVAAAFGFRDDLKYARKYRCNGGKRCWDSARGPWWTAWHSAYNYYPYNRIDDDTSHGAATVMLLFYALQDEWGVFNWGDVDKFRKHFERRRWYDDGQQYYVPQYPDSDSFPGNACAMHRDCTAMADDVEGSGGSRKSSGWSMMASVLGRNGFRNKVRNLQPEWNQIRAGGDYRRLFSAAFALYGEVGSPRRIGM
jgi:hypothetical protein